MFYLHAYKCTMCMQYFQKPEEGVESLRTKGPCCCELSYGSGKWTWLLEKKSHLSRPFLSSFPLSQSMKIVFFSANVTLL